MPPLTFGKTGQNAGLLTPLILPIFKTAPARSAPVEPILTRAFMSSLLLTSSILLTSELSFLVLIASVGLSLQLITSGA